MSTLKTALDQKTVESVVIWQAATGDGYWVEAANKDIQYIYLLGQLQASESMHASFNNNATRLRVKRLKRLIKENRKDAVV